MKKIYSYVTDALASLRGKGKKAKKKATKHSTLMMEALEERALLSVTTGAPISMQDIIDLYGRAETVDDVALDFTGNERIVELETLSTKSLMSAIENAKHTAGDEVILVYTNQIDNRLSLGSGQLDLTGYTGTITIVGFGDTRLTIESTQNEVVRFDPMGKTTTATTLNTNVASGAKLQFANVTLLAEEEVDTGTLRLDNIIENAQELMLQGSLKMRSSALMAMASGYYKCDQQVGDNIARVIGINPKDFDVINSYTFSSTSDYDVPGNFWVDAEKRSADIDKNMCWGGAVSNMIWYTGWAPTSLSKTSGSAFGNYRPTKTFASEDDVYEEYRNGFTNRGCEVFYSSEWFLNGTFRPQSWGNWSMTRVDNTNYGNIWNGLPVVYRGSAYYFTGNSETSISHQVSTTGASAYTGTLWNYADEGRGLGTHIQWSGGGHLIACWGMIKSLDNSQIISLFITDPDDNRFNGASAPNRLHHYRVKNGGTYFTTYGYGAGKGGGTRIVSITALANIGGSMQVKIDLKARQGESYVNSATLSSEVFITGQENITAQNVQVWLGEATDNAESEVSVDFYVISTEDYKDKSSFTASAGTKVGTYTSEDKLKKGVKEDITFDQILDVSELEKGDYYVYWIISNADSDSSNNMNFFGDDEGNPIAITSAYVDLAMDDTHAFIRNEAGQVLTGTNGVIDITYGDKLTLSGLEVINIGSLPTTKAHTVNVYLTTEKDKVQDVGSTDFLLASYTLAETDKVEYLGEDYDYIFLYPYSGTANSQWIDELMWNRKTVNKYVFYDQKGYEVAEFATEEMAGNSSYISDSNYTMRVEARPMTTSQIKWEIYKTDAETHELVKVKEFTSYNKFATSEYYNKPEYTCRVVPNLTGQESAYEKVTYNGVQYNAITFTLDTANMAYNKNYYITWEIVQSEDKMTNSLNNPGKGVDGGDVNSRNVGSLETSLHFNHTYLTDASEYYEILQTNDELTFPAMKVVYNVAGLEPGTYMEDPDVPGRYLVIDRSKVTPVLIDGNKLNLNYAHTYVKKLSEENGEDALDMMAVVHTTQDSNTGVFHSAKDMIVLTEADSAGVFSVVALGDWVYTDANGNEVEVDANGDPIIPDGQSITKVANNNQVYFQDSKGARRNLVVNIQFEGDAAPMLRNLNVVIETQINSSTMDDINRIVANFNVFDKDHNGVVIAEDELGYIFAINEDGKFYKILDPQKGTAVQVMILNKTRRDIPFTIDAKSLSRVMLIEEGQVQLANVKLTGGKVYGYGGGIYVKEKKEGGSETAHLTLQNVTIADNVATTYGGGIYNDVATLSIYDSTFSGNKANLGGGIRNAGNMIISGTTISKNAATDLGGGVYSVADSTKVVEVTHSIIRGNTAEIGAGFYQTSLQVSGGSTLATTLMDNTEIAGNSANIAAGVYNNGMMELVNVTIAGNSATSTGGGLFHNSGELIVNNSIISLNYAGGKATNIYGTPNEELSANNLIDSQSAWFEEDPVFGLGGRVVNVDTMDLRLTQSSQAIDAGNNDFVNVGDVDLDGRDRIYMPPEDIYSELEDEEAQLIDGIVDLGCYEFQGSANLNTVYYYEVVADESEMSASGSVVINEWTPFHLDLRASEGFLSTVITVQYDASIYKMDMDNTFASVYTTWDIGDPVELMTGMTQVKISVTVKDGVVLANDALIGQIAYLPVDKGGVNAWSDPVENWMTLGGMPVRLAIAPNRFDLTDDGVVNLSDMFLFLDKYGTDNATTDYNGNGKVDVDDMLTFAKHYGDELTYHAPASLALSTTSMSASLKKATSAMDLATLDKIFGEY